MFTKMVRKMTIWFYQLEGQEALGPVPTETLKTLAKNGKLKPTDLIWKDGYEKWVKAKRLQGLFPKSIFVLPPIPDDRKNKTESTSGQNKQENIYQIKIQPNTAKIQEKDSTQINLDQLINPDKNIAQASYNLNKHEPNNNRQDFPPPLPVTTEDAQIWFFSKGKTQYGPISSSELLKLSAIGQINPEDMTWSRDIPDWIPFKETILFKSKPPKGSSINEKGKTKENVLMSDNYPQKNSGDIISTKKIATTNETEFLPAVMGTFPLISDLIMVVSVFLPWFSGTIQSHSLGGSVSSSASFNYGIFVAAPCLINFILILFQLILKTSTAKTILCIISAFVFFSATSYSGYMGFLFNLGSVSSSVNIAGLASSSFEIKNGPGPYVALTGSILGIVSQMVLLFFYVNKKNDNDHAVGHINSDNNLRIGSFENQVTKLDTSDWSIEKLTNDKHKYLEKKVAAGIFAILLGTFGIHKFILGLKQAGIITLCGTLFCGPAACLFSFILIFIFPFGMFLLFLPGIFHVLGIVEGIIYLTIDNEAFYQKYRIEQKQWL